MKKTLVALTVAALASSASALTVYEQDGSKVDFNGSIRLLLDNGSSKLTKVAEGNNPAVHGKKTKKHSNLHNDGSRFGVTLKHNLAEDLFAIGRVEFRFDDEAETTDKFGDLYAKRAYVGLGSKQFGELTFGRQVLIGDDIAQSGFDNAYGTFDTTLATASNAAVRYDYKGIEGLQVGLDYRFAEKRDANHQVKAEELKSGYSVGAIYTFKPADNQSLTVASGYSRDNFATEANYRAYKDAYAFGAKYTIDAFTLGFDYAGANLKGVKFDGDNKKAFSEHGRTTLNWFRVGAKYAVTPEIAVYTNYGHGVANSKVSGKTEFKHTFDKYMLGTEYKVHKNVFTYLEGGVAQHKVKNAAGVQHSKTTDKNIGLGLRVHW